MRIGVDARALVHQPMGVARYLTGILREIPKLMGSEDTLVLYVDQTPEQPLPGDPDRVELLRWPLPGGDPVWRQVRLGSALHWNAVDVLFCPFYSIPLSPSLPSVVTIHDVAFLAHPEWFDWRSRLAFRLVRPSARKAARILTDSEFSAAEIVRLLRLPRTKIDVTPPGVDSSWFLRPAPTTVEQLHDWLGFDGPYLLHFGAVHARRLPEVLVNAFVRLPGGLADHRLVIAGPTLQPVSAAAIQGNAARVVRREWVPEELVRALVAEARVVAYLSLYEGFGLPALEAMAAGTPLVALRSASLPELCEDAALWVEQPDPETVAQALTNVLQDQQVALRLRTAGQARARSFTWSRTAEGTWNALKRAVARAPGLDR